MSENNKLNYFVYRVEEGFAHIKDVSTNVKEMLALRDSYRSNGFDSFVKDEKLRIIL